MVVWSWLLNDGLGDCLYDLESVEDPVGRNAAPVISAWIGGARDAAAFR
jgi:hypothetical protein